MSAAALPITEASSITLQPLLKWAGGKRWLVDDLQAFWRPGSRLVEPFAGGLSVALGLQPRNALLNDANPHLINFYSWVQRGLDIHEAGVTLANDRAVYLHNRARFNELISTGQGDSREAGVLFYFLNRVGFNGLCRFSKTGVFNVPFGKYGAVTFRRDLSAYRDTFSRFTFQHGDFERLRLRQDDFVYADPPYDVEFTEYSAGGFSWDDQERLAHWLAAHRGPVVASNQATRRIVKLYRSLGFRVRKLPAPRRISCNGDRSDAMEILATKGV